MTQSLKKKLVCAFATLTVTAVAGAGVAMLCTPDFTTASAASGSWAAKDITVEGGNVTLSSVTTNPVNYVDEAVNGMLTGTGETVNQTVMKSTNPVIFTAAYPFTTTGREGAYTEYTVEYDETKKSYNVTAVNESGDGNTYIPVGGYVLSVSNSAEFSVDVGTTLTTTGTLVLPDKAVEADSGARVAIDAINSNRSAPMVVYYDYEFGAKTGTNVYGSEMAAVFDADSGKFEVKEFRKFGEGDASGMVIPDNGFVLSAYGDGYRGIFHGNTRFEEGDLLSLVGFDYIRFGGDPITYTYTYDYYDESNPDDACHTNPGRMETETTPFAAYRGSDQTIVYHYGWSYNGSTGTGTNVYGFEAAVDANGVVVERAVNVTSIPVGGYVLSGHGKGRDFIRSNVSLGANITLDQDTKTFSITTSLNSFYVNTKSTVDEIITSAENKMKQLYDLDTEALTKKISETRALMEELEQLKTSIEEKSKENTWSNLEKTREMMAYNTAKLTAEANAYEILALAQESKPVTARATWHRPTEKTLEELTATLDTYKEIGINMIFVESFFNGYSMFQSDYVEYHKDFRTANYGEYADYLSAFTALATERGIEVHAWVENFYVGLTTEIKLLQEHPDWIMYNDDGTYYQRKEGGAYIFLDPTNTEVQDFLITYYKELLEKNPLIKGLNLDYIRYPVSDSAQDTGYTKNSMLAFAESVGVTKINESMELDKMIKEFKKWVLNSAYNQNAEENYEKWCEYRRNAVSSYVNRINLEIRQEKGILLSTAVFSSITESKEQKKQDWQSWFKSGWIDVATPMAYFDSSTDVLNGVSDMILTAGSNCYYYTGLASSYRGMAAYENAYQIEASYLGGANGYVIFCSTQIIGHEDVQAVLKSGFNSQPAVLPHASVSEVLNAYFDRIETRIDKLYMPAELMTEAQKTELLAEFDKILAMDDVTAADLEAVRTAVARLYKSTVLPDYAKGYAARRIQETLTELNDLLETKVQILGGVQDEPVTPPAGSDSTDSTSSADSSSAGSKKKGCNASMAICGGVVAVLGLGAAMLLKKKRD